MFALIFLVVAAGYAVGRVKLAGVGLGATASTLLIAMIVSVVAAERGVELHVPELVGTVFFNLFMFSVGMKVGPQFLAGMRRDALHFIAIGIAIPVGAFALMLGVRAVFHLEPGMLPGVFAGANTATPGLGAAQAAFSSRNATPAVVASMSTAFAFAYSVSTILFVVFTKLPELLGRDVTGAARSYEATLHGSDDAPLPGTGGEFIGRPMAAELRTFEIEMPNVAGHRVDELRVRVPQLSVERIRRGDQVLEPRDDLVLQLRDTVAVFGEIPMLVAAGPRIGPEVYDRAIRDVGSQTVDIVVGQPSSGRTLEELAAGVGHGLYLDAMFRGGEQLPHGPKTEVRKGDVLRVTGSNYRIKLLERLSGRIVKPSISTDIVTLALGVSLGALVGMIAIPIGHMRIHIGAAVGLLVVGIVLSILRTRHPALGGPYPEPARKLIEDLGLNVFVAALGLSAGSGVVGAVAHGTIVPILLIGLAVGFLPAVLVWLVWTRVFHMNDALLLGAVAGGRCNSAGMQAAQEATRSSVPAISYPATFAISNVLFTLFAYLMALID